MNKCETRRGELRALMEETLRVCIRLRTFSEDNFDVFLCDDDARILAVINKRESFIESLISLEYRIDGILNDVEEYGYGETLPPEADEIRQSIRSVLDEISARDIEIMKLIGGKMQRYRTETLKARNKKSLAAYLSAAQGPSLGDSVDCLK
jgi:hypothetical protein